MVPFNVLVAVVCLGYVIFLFLVAFSAERRAQKGRVAWPRSPWVYTLSLSIYCTAWTFYGAVGYAARSGLEFVTIYLWADAGDGRLVGAAAQACQDRGGSASPRSPT